MISEEREAEILAFLRKGDISIRRIALKLEVAPKTIRDVRDNREYRAATRARFLTNKKRKLAFPSEVKLKEKGAVTCPTCRAKVTILPCVYCRNKEKSVPLNGNWEDKLNLNKQLGEKESKKFVYIARDIINLDAINVIHHPLFTSLVVQARAALNLLPEKPTVSPPCPNSPPFSYSLLD